MTYSDDYLAGVFDGEGTITAYRSSKGHWVLRVGVGMSAKHIVEAFQCRFGGGFHSRKKRTAGGLQMHEWYLCGGAAVEFLAWAISHCHEKNKQAKVALPLAEQIRQYGISRQGKGPKDRIISDADRTERTKIVETLLAMNGARNRFQKSQTVVTTS